MHTRNCQTPTSTAPFNSTAAGNERGSNGALPSSPMPSSQSTTTRTRRLPISQRHIAHVEVYVSAVRTTDIKKSLFGLPLPLTPSFHLLSLIPFFISPHSFINMATQYSEEEIAKAHEVLRQQGLAVRREVAGPDYVARSLAAADNDFARSMQEVPLPSPSPFPFPPLLTHQPSTSPKLPGAASGRAPASPAKPAVY